MLKISYAGCPDLSPAISAHFTLKMCVAARNREKFIKNLSFCPLFVCVYVSFSVCLSLFSGAIN